MNTPIQNKSKLTAEEISSYEEINGELVIKQLLFFRGLKFFPERYIQVKDLVEVALIHYGLTFSAQNKRCAYHCLTRFYHRNGFEMTGTFGKESVKIPRKIFEEAERRLQDERNT